MQLVTRRVEQPAQQAVRPAEQRVQLVTRRVEQPAQQEMQPAEQRVQLVMRRVEQLMRQEVQPVEQRVQQEVRPAERRVQQEVRPAELSEQLVTRRVEQLAQQEMRPAELSEQPVTRRVVSQVVLHGAPAGSASIGPGNAPTASIAAPTDEVGARAVASLPAGLLPTESGGGTIGPWVAYVPEFGQVHGTKEALSGLARGLKSVPGTPLSAIRACRDRIASLSQPYGAIRVEAAGAGRLAQRRRGLTEAPIWARILYRRAGLTQVRQARVTCQLDARGQVLAVRSGLTS